MEEVQTRLGMGGYEEAAELLLKKLGEDSFHDVASTPIGRTTPLPVFNIPCSQFAAGR
jgi:hypothetical protein